MRGYISLAMCLTIFLCGLSAVPVHAGEKGPIWFARGQVWYHDSQTEDVSSTFLLKRARFGIKGWAAEDWIYHFLVDAAVTPKLLQAWVEYTWIPELKIRIGQFKHGFGRETLPPETRWKFINPSQVVGTLGKSHVSGGSFFRDQGIMAYGKMDAGRMSVGYSLFLMNGSGINTQDTDGKKDLVGHLGVALPAGLAMGGTFYLGEDGETELGRSGVGVDISFAKDKIWILAEFLGGTIEQGQDDDLQQAGYHLGTTYMVTKAIEAGLRYDSWDENTDNDNDAISRITLGLSYYLAKLNRITLNYEIPSHENDDVDLDPTFVVQFQGSLN